MIEEHDENYNEQGATDIFTVIPKQEDLLQYYLKDIGKIKLLKRDEELNLGAKIANGSKKEAEIARKKLIQANLRLVVSIAKKVHRTRSSLYGLSSGRQHGVNSCC